MTADELRYKQHCLSIIAEMNQRYHQAFATRWEWRDKGCRIAVGFVAVLDVIVAAVTASTEEHVSWLPIVVASLAAIVAIVLNVVPLLERAHHHSDLFRQWSDFREEVDAVAYDFSDEVTADVVERLRRLDGKMHRICGSEPNPDHDFLRECQIAAERWRQQPDHVVAASP